MTWSRRSPRKRARGKWELVCREDVGRLRPGLEATPCMELRLEVWICFRCPMLRLVIVNVLTPARPEHVIAWLTS